MLDLSALDREGLGDMPIRSREIGMRLALICTLSDTPDTPTITTDIVDWCFAYVEFFLHQTLHALRTRVADSATERTRNQVLARSARPASAASRTGSSTAARRSSGCRSAIARGDRVAARRRSSSRGRRSSRRARAGRGTRWSRSKMRLAQKRARH
jgi:hypothetical protein